MLHLHNDAGKYCSSDDSAYNVSSPIWVSMPRNGQS